MSNKKAAMRMALLAGSTAMLACGHAVAQSTASTSGNSAPLEEIVVTAQRREEILQKVPASIAAFSRKAIEAFHISDVGDVTRLTPGLSTTTESGLSENTNIAIRGIASYVGTATTAIYIDDTPLQVRYIGAGESAANAYPTVFDLERIEVLRGPQGTLFGASSEGGTVRFITPQPGLEAWSGHARSEFSANETGGLGYQLGVAAGGPIVPDKLGVRVSAYSEQDAGWTRLQPYPGTNLTNKNSNSNSVNAVNAALEWVPTDDITITPSVFWQRRDSDNQSFFWRSLSNRNDDRFVSGQLFPQPVRDEFTLAAIKAKWEFDDFTVFSNISYLDHDNHSLRDYSFGLTETLTGDIAGPSAPAPSYQRNPQKQFTQELRLQSTGSDEDFHWVVGEFYQDSREEAFQTVVQPGLGGVIAQIFGGATVAQVFGVDQLPGAVDYTARDTARDRQLAFFAQADYKILSQFTLTGGLRFVRSLNSFDNAQDGPFNGGPSAGNGGSSETDVLPKIALTYNIDSDALVYASAARGFRPGGGNVPVSAALCSGDLQQLGYSQAPDKFDADHVWSYELGTKGNAFGRRVIWEASAFYIDWTQIQNAVYLSGCGLSFIGNLGTAVSQGIDAQVQAALTPELTASVAFDYTNAHYTKTIAGSGGGGNLVTNGQPLQTPPWHIVVALDYTPSIRLWDGEPYLHADYQFTSHYHVSDPRDALYDPAVVDYGQVDVVNLRVGYKRDGMDLSVFIQNLLDAHPILYTNHTVPTSSLYLDSTIAPRVIGVTATWGF